MGGSEPKKLALIRILQILERHSNYEHPLTHADIANYLEHDYGIVMERKSIARNLSLLKEADVDIFSGTKGSYISSREFDDSELRMLIDGVLCSKYITAKHSKDLIEKLCNLSDKYFRSHVKNIHTVGDRNKTSNKEVFYNIATIDDAITERKQISFVYNKYGLDKKLHHTKSHIASPYGLILHNQRYYLMALSEKWKNIGYYHLDHITNMRIVEENLTNIRSVEGYENGINYKELSASKPYMFADTPEIVEFITDEPMIDQVIDWFGFDVKVQKEEDNKIRVTLKVSLKAMEYWAMQYIKYVEVISPKSLRKKIKKNLANAIKKYD